MLWDASAINGYAIAASDGRLGTVSDFLFDDDAWILMRLSGTEPLLRIYSEAGSIEESKRLAADARAWVFNGAAEGAKS